MPDIGEGKKQQRTGRHLLYIVWQNSSTPDTYYSCSDLVFPEPAAARPKPAPTTKPAPAATPAAAPSTPASPESTTPAQAITPVSDDNSQVTLGHRIIAAALAVAVIAAGWALVGGLLRRRRENR